MPAPDASTPARDAIDAFLRHLADRDLSATTRRIRKTYLNEYLRHAQQDVPRPTKPAARKKRKKHKKRKKAISRPPGR